MSKELPNLRDLEIFLWVCDYLTRHGGQATLRELERSLQTHASTISEAVTGLERYCDCGPEMPLIERSRGRGYGPVTEEGQRVYDRGTKLFKMCEQLRHEFRATDRVVIATTNSIRLYLLRALIPAHLLKGKREGRQDLPRMEIVERDTVEMVKGVRDGTFDFGVGWAGAETALADKIHSEPLPLPPVGIVALFPDRGFLETLSPESNLVALLDEHDGAGIPVGRFGEVLRSGKVWVAALKSDFVPELSAFLEDVAPNRIVWVDHMEDVFACIRMCEAEVGWAPQWYARRLNCEFRQILTEDSAILSRRIVLYTRAGGKARGKPSLSDPAREVVETLKAYLEYFAESFVSEKQGDPGTRPYSPAGIRSWLNETNKGGKSRR